MTINLFRPAKIQAYCLLFILLLLTKPSLTKELTPVKEKKIVEYQSSIENKIRFSQHFSVKNIDPSTQDSCPITLASKKLMEITNASRSKTRKCGRKRKRRVRKLKHSCALSKMALNHAAQLYEQGSLTHQSSDGSGISERAEKLGIQWKALGENIAFGYSSAESVHAGWLNSKPHCKNIMNPTYNRIGLAEHQGYWVVVFSEEKQ